MLLEDVTLSIRHGVIMHIWCELPLGVTGAGRAQATEIALCHKVMKL